jgi:3-phenylpropionate/cinnamic acid dioxygenase small subunit
MTTTDDLQAKVVLQYQLEHFYFEEAAMLDERRFEEWVDLFTDDTHYWMPIRRTRTLNEIDKEFSARGGMSYYDDDKAMLETRVRKLGTGYSWAEDPPSRTRHNINNVRVVEDRGDELVVESNFLLYRTRLNSEEDTWIGRRHDTLRRVDGSFKIADRKIFIDQTVILSRNLSNFF